MPVSGPACPSGLGFRHPRRSGRHAGGACHPERLAPGGVLGAEAEVLDRLAGDGLERPGIGTARYPCHVPGLPALDQSLDAVVRLSGPLPGRPDRQREFALAHQQALPRRPEGLVRLSYCRFAHVNQRKSGPGAIGHPFDARYVASRTPLRTPLRQVFQPSHR